jgi:hypothetical protein
VYLASQELASHLALPAELHLEQWEEQASHSLSDVTRYPVLQVSHFSGPAVEQVMQLVLQAPQLPSAAFLANPVSMSHLPSTHWVPVKVLSDT